MAAADVHPVEAEAYRILRSRINLSHLAPLTRAVTERMIQVSADFDYAADLVCHEEALAAAVAALAAGAAVVADSPVVAAAIAAEITECEVVCKAADPLTARLARVTGIPPAAAAVRLAFSEAGPGAVWVAGTAPTALAEILARSVEPALVIGMPAGFVGAAEAKESLRASGLPSLSNVSEKGGAVVAAAAAVALLDASGAHPAGAASAPEGRDG